MNSFHPELQLKDIESAITNKLNDLWSELKDFNPNSKAETVINESDTDDVCEPIYSTIISNTQKYLGQGSGWIIDSVLDHNINISKYNSLVDSSYIKLQRKK